MHPLRSPLGHPRRTRTQAMPQLRLALLEPRADIQTSAQRQAGAMTRDDKIAEALKQAEQMIQAAQRYDAEGKLEFPVQTQMFIMKAVELLSDTLDNQFGHKSGRYSLGGDAA